MVEVFKTNVQKRAIARNLLKQLECRFPGHRINFDLQDCDRILRLEGENIEPSTVIQLLEQEGYACEWLRE